MVIRPGSRPQGMACLGLQYSITLKLGDPSVLRRPRGLLLPYWNGLMTLPGKVCLDTSCGDYLNSGFSEVDSACKVFPYKGIGVVCPLEDPL